MKKVPFHDFLLLSLSLSSREKKLHLLLCKLNVDDIDNFYFFFSSFPSRYRNLSPSINFLHYTSLTRNDVQFSPFPPDQRI